MWMKYLNSRKASINRKSGLLIIAIGFFIFIAFNTNAQFSYESIIETDASFFTIDPLDNIYLAESGAIIKINESTGERSNFSNPLYGSFDIIDSSDPLNILAFSASLGIITFLDKNLVEKETFSINDDFFKERPGLACNSRLEGFWVYYPELWQFSRINRKNQVLTTTLPMHNLEYNFSEPCFMIETDSRLYVSDYENGIFVFDVFGGFLFKIPLKNVCTFQVLNNYIVYFTKNQLCLYDFFLHKESLILLPEANIKSGFLNYPFVYLLTKQGLKKYYTIIELF